MLFRKKKKNEWEKYFSDISDGQMILSKFMVINCLDFCNKIQSSGVLSDFTNGQYYESIAFIKTFHFHLITQCQISHNLFYGFYSEIHPMHSQGVLEDIVLEIDSIKTAEHWYMTTYFDSVNSPMISIMERYYRRLVHLQNDNVETNIKLSTFEDFQQIVGPILEEIHLRYL